MSRAVLLCPAWSRLIPTAIWLWHAHAVLPTCTFFRGLECIVPPVDGTVPPRVVLCGTSCAQVLPSPDLLAAARGAVDAWAPLAGHPHLCALRAAFVSAELSATGACRELLYLVGLGCASWDDASCVW